MEQHAHELLYAIAAPGLAAQWRNQRQRERERAYSNDPPPSGQDCSSIIHCPFCGVNHRRELLQLPQDTSSVGAARALPRAAITQEPAIQGKPDDARPPLFPELEQLASGGAMRLP